MDFSTFHPNSSFCLFRPAGVTQFFSGTCLFYFPSSFCAVFGVISPCISHPLPVFRAGTFHFGFYPIQQGESKVTFAGPVSPLAEFHTWPLHHYLRRFQPFSSPPFPSLRAFFQHCAVLFLLLSVKRLSLPASPPDFLQGFRNFQEKVLDAFFSFDPPQNIL